MKTAKIALGLIAACAVCCAAPLFAALTLGLGGFGSLLSGELLPALVAVGAVSLTLICACMATVKKGQGGAMRLRYKFLRNSPPIGKRKTLLHATQIAAISDV